MYLPSYVPTYPLPYLTRHHQDKCFSGWESAWYLTLFRQSVTLALIESFRRRHQTAIQDCTLRSATGYKSLLFSQ